MQFVNNPTWMSSPSEQEKQIKANQMLGEFFQKFYPYYSKPTIVPLLKKLVGLFAGFALGFFLIANLTGLIVSGVSNTYLRILINWNSLLYLFITMVIIYYTSRAPQNERQKYNISIWYAVITFIYTAFWLFWILSFWKAIEAEEANQTFKTTWKALKVIHMILMILVVTLFIFAFLLKPKLDQEKIQKFYKEVNKWKEAYKRGEEYQINIAEFQ